MSSYILTSECVSDGHPDKVADQISDSIVDLYLSTDDQSKVAVETMVKGNNVYIAGEVTSNASIPQDQIESIVRATICDIGYSDNELRFNGLTCNIQFDLSKQSPEINKAVVTDDGLMAGDQGLMFGYATRETPNHMPLALYLSKRFITSASEYGTQVDELRPDMKSQVSIAYENGTAESVHSVVFSCCHSERVSLQQLREIFFDEILTSVIDEPVAELFTPQTLYHINPAGEWNIGGPASDCGLTGRKIVVDQYGADCEIGGGAFSGKDASKIDRSGAYMARHVALKTLKSNPEVKKIKVQLAYVIGQKYPVSYRVFDPTNNREYGLGEFSLEDLTPSSIIERLNLRSPIFLDTAKYGHFGISPYDENGLKYFGWERV